MEPCRSSVSASVKVAAVFGVRSLVLPPSAGRGDLTRGLIVSTFSVSGGLYAFSVSGATAFRRPSVVTLPYRLAFWSTDRSSFAFTWASSRPRSCLLIRAATPTTCGVAIEVPL
jgi:hypothetical protein